MNYIKGKLKKIIFQNNETGYVVALFRIRETNDLVMEDKINKSVTVTGVFTEVNIDINMTLYGKYIKNEKFGMQYQVESYEVDKPTTKDAIIEFLASNFVEGCGEKTAKKIVEHFGTNTLDIIKDNKDALLEIEGMSAIKAAKIYNSIINYNKSSDDILKLQNLGFNIEECSKIYNKFKLRIDDILGDSFYDLKEIIDFKKLDNIYINNFGDATQVRVNACILESMQVISDLNGDTYYYSEEVLNVLNKMFNIYLAEDTFSKYLELLKDDKKIVIVDQKIYLKKYYDEEIYVALALKKIDGYKIELHEDIRKRLENLEKRLNIDYNETQEKAIISALNNNVSIISGGPGTGKTTIINAIVKLYIELHALGPKNIMDEIALLAPTGRASKKLSTSTNLPASTIHRYLKWYKDSNEFCYNEYNKTSQHLIIVDEVSMIDIDLFASLLKGINPHVKLILVGDIFQLPSVGPGLVLSDLISTDYFNFVPLNQIYRQSDNSYIPYLCKEIKNNDLSEEFLEKRDDYSFLQTKGESVKDAIKQIIKLSLAKNINERKMQVLAPMYKGENGIDNLNVALQSIYNPKSDSKAEVAYKDVIYREGDKVLQLVNDLDNNVFNGDIGFIEMNINGKIRINFEGNIVEYEKKNLHHIKHAYAITIHKSQGSEFEHVIMPVVNSYYKMLYNKLIYTGISRAKKSITLVGDATSFVRAVNNNYSENRKTSLKDKIFEVYKTDTGK